MLTSQIPLMIMPPQFPNSAHYLVDSSLLSVPSILGTHLSRELIVALKMAVDFPYPFPTRL